jgi:hypothetical protein
MSQRPRLAGDGRLEVPAKIAFDHHGFIRGRFSDRTIDPFDWTEDRLLLAESFARLDLADRGAVKAWWTTHGAVDLIDFTGGEGALPDEHEEWLEHRPQNAFIESREEAAEEQATIRWHLETLVHLTEHRDDKRWDPAWGEFVLDGPDAFLMGGPDSGTRLWPSYRFDQAGRYPDQFDPGEVERQTNLLPEVARRPRVVVRGFAWYGTWGDVQDYDAVVELEPALFRSLGSTWDTTIELERLLIEPYVARAVERRFGIELAAEDDAGRRVLVPREWRSWGSVLAPIYLQLFEALRRVSEGEPGAAICHECGRPFVVLDARRRFFCNERERYRHAKRQQRKRASAKDAVTISDSAAIEIVRGYEP